MKKVILIVLTLILALSACTTKPKDSESKTELPYDVSSKPEQQTSEKSYEKAEESEITEEIKEEQEIMLGDYEFNMLRALYDGSSNIMYSPTSIKYAIGMLSNFAQEETYSEIAEAMFNGDALEKTNEHLEYMMNGLEKLEQAKVNVANSIWINEIVTGTDEEAIESIKQLYNGEIARANFGDSQTCIKINDWVKENTEGLIDSIIDETNNDEVMHLINAIYLKADWARVFEKESTRDYEFKTIMGETQEVPFMMDTRRMEYVKDDTKQALVLPYSEGGLTCILVMPTGMEMNEFVREFNRNDIEDILKAKESKMLNVKIPIIKMEAKYSLEDALRQIGINKIFSKEQSGLERAGSINGNANYISDALQKVYFRLDEQGTEAAAVTQLTMNATGALLPEETEDMIFDNPFMILVMCDEEALFTGIINSIE